MQTYLGPTQLPSDDKRWKIVEATARRHGREPHALIETLHTVQESFGYLDESALRFVASYAARPPQPGLRRRHLLPLLHSQAPGQTHLRRVHRDRVLRQGRRRPARRDRSSATASSPVRPPPTASSPSSPPAASDRAASPPPSSSTATSWARSAPPTCSPASKRGSPDDPRRAPPDRRDRAPERRQVPAPRLRLRRRRLPVLRRRATSPPPSKRRSPKPACRTRSASRPSAAWDCAATARSSPSKAGRSHVRTVTAETRPRSSAASTTGSNGLTHCATDAPFFASQMKIVCED